MFLLQLHRAKREVQQKQKRPHKSLFTPTLLVFLLIPRADYFPRSIITSEGYQVLGVLWSLHSALPLCKSTMLCIPKANNSKKQFDKRNSNNRKPEGKCIFVHLIRDLGSNTTTCHSLPEDYETCLHHCQHLSAYKHHIPTGHRELRSPRICFWLECGHCGQSLIFC